MLLALAAGATSVAAQVAGQADPNPVASLRLQGRVQGTLPQADGAVLVFGSFDKGIARLDAKGVVDTTFNPGLGIEAKATISSATRQSDGKIIINGDFYSFDGVARKHIARLNADGSLDTTFHPDGQTYAGISIESVAVRTDGKIFAALLDQDNSSDFPIPNDSLLCFNADGSNNTSFHLDVDSGNQSINYIAAQSNNKLLIISSLFERPIVRLNADGSLDEAFNLATGVNGNSVTVQSDGKILIADGFSSSNGDSGIRLNRLNIDGSLDSAYNAGTILSTESLSVSSIALQDDGKILIAGDFTTFNGISRHRLARLNANGILDNTFDLGEGSAPNTFFNSVAVQGNSGVFITGDFTTINGSERHSVARLGTDGSLDAAFIPDTVLSGANSPVRISTVQSDGKIIVAGDFTTFDGVSRKYFARLNADGNLDPAFDASAGPDIASIDNLEVQPNGKILVAGDFTGFDGAIRKFFARLDTDGSLDTAFNPVTSTDEAISSVAVQGDGKFVVAGSFTTLNGISRRRIGRFNADGSLDTTFNAGTGPDKYITSLAAQKDGKILVFGSFDKFNGVSRHRLARLNADGSLDAGFKVGSFFEANAVVPQADGKVLFRYTEYDFTGPTESTSTDFVARTNADGTPDSSFSTGQALTNQTILCMAVQGDGKILLGGTFTFFNDIARSHLIRLNTDGSVDTAFTAGTDGDSVSSLTVQGDGKILVGGDFTHVNGSVCNFVARLNADGQLDPDFLRLVIKPGTPGITSSLNPPSREGVPFGYQITATNSPTGFATQGLPAGLGLNKQTGKISGTPSVPGTYRVLLNATNSVATGTATMTLVVKQEMPRITSDLNPPSRQGVPFGYQITATNKPTGYGASGLPAGLAVNTGTGKISGTPASAGTFAVTIKASNSGGSDLAALNLVVKKAVPVITSSLNPPSRQGVEFSYQITATNSPASYGVAGLPAGLSVDRATGKINGAPGKSGTYSVTLKATNSGGSGTAVLTLVVKPPLPPPVITSSLNPPSRRGVAFSYQITATNSPTNFATRGLPGGMGLNKMTGKISGTPAKAGTYRVTITAANSGGSGEATMTIVVKPPA